MADYVAHLVVMLSVYAMLVYALNLIAGDSGLLAFCVGGFWGVGAYAAALASIGNSIAAATAPNSFVALLRVVMTGLSGRNVRRCLNPPPPTATTASAGTVARSDRSARSGIRR